MNINRHIWDIEYNTKEEVINKILILLHEAIDENFSTAIAASSRQFTQTVLTVNDESSESQALKQTLEQIQKNSSESFTNQKQVQNHKNDSVYSEYNNLSHNQIKQSITFNNPVNANLLHQDPSDSYYASKQIQNNAFTQSKNIETNTMDKTLITRPNKSKFFIFLLIIIVCIIIGILIGTLFYIENWKLNFIEKIQHVLTKIFHME